MYGSERVAEFGFVDVHAPDYAGRERKKVYRATLVREMEATRPYGGDELSPGTDVGGYIVDSKIGEGGMGAVYGARHPQNGKSVAIKVLAPMFCADPSAVKRFEQEARVVDEIHHPNIVDVFHLGELPDGRKYLVMEWLEGESLTDRIERGPIAPRDAVEIVDSMCDAIQAVHDKGVIHRDLKSDNVFLARDGVKLLDFGLAKLSVNDPRALTRTKTGIVVGTPAYMAPEQARAQAIDHRVDIYALGVLTFKMLTAQLPFQGEAVELIMQHLKTPPPAAKHLAPAVPDELSQIIMRMMAKSAAERPTLAEVRAACSTLRTTLAPPPPKSSTTATIIFVAIALALVATVAFFLITEL